ncbi:MAG: tetratricopeptide repeat protein [Magnetococcales bacterium]|nr:tetratricopeptide repeat protein [Magnetococcales bacterium]
MRFYLIVVVGLFSLLIAAAPVQAGLMDEIYQLTDRKQYGAALSKLNQFLKTNPNDAQARFLKGLVLTEQGERNEAITVFQSLSQDYPDLPEPYNNLAVLYAERGEYDKARSALEKAIKTHPNYVTAHENLGDIYAKMASKAYRQALSLNGSSQVIKAKLDYIKKVFNSRADLPPPYQEREVEHLDKPKTPPPPPPSQQERPAQAFVSVQDDLFEVELAVDNWIKAWSSLDINRYLDSYSKKFHVPAKFPNYNAWVQNRRRVIGKAKTIRVTYKDLRVKLLDKDLARAEFKQHYWSPNYQDEVNKTLSLTREGKRWKILWERSDG